jgi:hypothetical protein
MESRVDAPGGIGHDTIASPRLPWSERPFMDGGSCVNLEISLPSLLCEFINRTSGITEGSITGQGSPSPTHTNDALLASALVGLQDYWLDRSSTHRLKLVLLLHKRLTTKIWAAMQPKKCPCISVAACMTHFVREECA